MYWKIYLYNHRLRLIAYAAMGIVGAAFTSLPMALVSENGRWFLRHARNATEASNIWKSAAGVTLPMLLVVFTFIAADLGASGIGEHAAKRPLDFLLTRPRQRRHFVWVGWSIGMLEITALMLLMLAVSCTVLTWLTSSFEPMQLSLSGLVLLSMIAVVFGISYLFAVVGGTARTGYPLAMAITMMFLAVAITRSTVPPAHQTSYTAAADWLLHVDEHAGLVAVMSLAASSLLLMVTQFTFEKKEF